MKKGKILLFTTDFPPAKGGGICTHSHFMVDSLSNLGWEFVVLSEYYIHCQDKEIKEYSKKVGYPIYRLPHSRNKLALFKKICFCYRIARKYKPDIILGTGRHTSWFAAIVSVLTRVKLVTIGHGTEFTEKTSEKDFKWNKMAYGKSDLLIAISEHTKAIVLENDIHPKRIEVIHNAANENEFYKIADTKAIHEFKELKGLKDKRIIVTSGALSERKGQRVVLKCLPEVIKTFPNVVYVAIGLPNKRDEFIELAKQLNVQENAIFPGIVSQNELLMWLNACDFFCMTSVNYKGDYEGFGIAVLEAALCGKTAVVSNNGGLKEAVEDKITGVVVPEGDIVATGAAICRLLGNDRERQSLANAAFEKVIQSGTYAKKGIEYDKSLFSLIKNEICY